MKRNKVTKILALLLVMGLLLVTVTACGSSSSSDATSSDKETVETTSGESDSDESDTIESDSSETDSEVLSPEFKKTMDDYEAWFDHYCEVMKKCNENPTDTELLSEMTTLLSEEAKMFEQMENMDQSEMNTAELAYYLEVTARIEKKLLEVAN